MTQRIRKAVFPVAGLGTRFLPATKANPKEMLPIVDKPLIQYAVEEAVNAGITELIFITSMGKRSIEDHFDSNYELESRLAAAGKDVLLALVRNILPPHVRPIYLRQQEPLGLGHAVFCARSVVGNEPFAVLLADDLIDGPCLEKMLKLYQTTRASVLAVENVPPQDSIKYGMVGIEFEPNGLQRMTQIVEKPRPEEAPSPLAAVGRYLFTPTIFDHLANTHTGAGNEIQLTDAIASLQEKEPVYAHILLGKRYDCGSKFDYMRACVDYALRHPEIASRFQAFLSSKINPEREIFELEEV